MTAITSVLASSYLRSVGECTCKEVCTSGSDNLASVRIINCLLCGNDLQVTGSSFFFSLRISSTQPAPPSAPASSRSRAASCVPLLGASSMDSGLRGRPVFRSSLLTFIDRSYQPRACTLLPHLSGRMPFRFGEDVSSVFNESDYFDSGLALFSYASSDLRAPDCLMTLNVCSLSFLQTSSSRCVLRSDGKG